MWKWLRRFLKKKATIASPGTPTEEPPPSQAEVKTLREDEFLQFPGREKAGNVRLVLGVDFGTSSTKVVIRSPDHYGSRAVAVRLASGKKPYLLPSQIFEDQDGQLSLQRSPGATPIPDLKLNVLYSPGDTASLGAAAGFLSLVMRGARRWFLNTQREGYARFQVEWLLNLGIPSAGYDDREIREAFRTVANASWALSLKTDRPNRGDAQRAVERARATEPDPGIDVIPEVAAEVVGYARSTLRDPGLHVMIDVGATTLDLCSFVLHEADGEDVYSFLTASVERLGVLQLHRYRIRAVGSDRLSRQINELDLADPMVAIPSSIRQYLQDGRVSEDEVSMVDGNFFYQCRRSLLRVLFDLKRARDPFSSRWKQGLPVFLCGGGSEMRFYQDVLAVSDNAVRTCLHVHGLHRRDLPKPDSLVNKDISDGLYHRLAVAFGLSYDTLDIGEIHAPSEIPDIPARAIEHREGGFISKEQV